MSSAPARPPHVLIVGAGLGGLVLAQCLRKKGVSFEIFERDASTSARGQGYAIGIHKLDELKPFLPDDVPPLESSCGLLPLPLPSQMTFYLGEKRVGVEDSPSTPCVRANRVRLRELLATNIHVQWGKRVDRIEQDDVEATVWFADGTSARGDVVVGADGTFSAVREYVLQRKNEEILQVVPEAIVLGQVTLSGSAFERQLRLGHSAYIAFGRGFRLFSGLTRVLPDGKSGEYYWMMFHSDANVGKPDHWLKAASTQETYKYCLDEAQALDPKFREIIELTGAEGLRGLVVFWQAELPGPPPAGRVVLLGDAAHPITPFRGEGGILAIQDATALSELLAEADAGDVPTLKASLAKFQTKCIARGSEAVALANTAMKKATAGENPMCWGYRSQPMEEKPLGIEI